VKFNCLVPRHLSRLIAQAQRGEPFVIAKSGKPQVLVSAIATEHDRAKARLGFLRGTMRIPDDFDRMGADQVDELFAGSAS